MAPHPRRWYSSKLKLYGLSNLSGQRFYLAVPTFILHTYVKFSSLVNLKYLTPRGIPESSFFRGIL
jgi:hypothetical protein